MNTTVKTSMLAAALALAFGGIAIAQNDGPPPPPPGGGGGMDRSGVIVGKVKSVDSSAKTIKIMRRGEICTVHVADGATIDAERTVNASDLKIGDRIAVHGVPTGISASNVIDGDPREALPPPPGDGEGPGDGPDEQGPGGPGGGRGRRNVADVSGKITSTDPLTIAVGSDVSIVVKVGSNAKVRKIVSEQISDIKAGDRIVASGDPGDDGRLDVDRVAINVHMPPPPPGMGGRGPGFGRPGFGGRGRRPGGFGGPQMGDNEAGGPGGFGGPPQGAPGMGPDGGQGGPEFGRGPGGPDDDGPDGAGAPPPPDMNDGQS